MSETITTPVTPVVNNPCSCSAGQPKPAPAPAAEQPQAQAAANAIPVMPKSKRNLRKR